MKHGVMNISKLNKNLDLTAQNNIKNIKTHVVGLCYIKQEWQRAEIQDKITEKVQSNPWVKRGGVDFEDDPFMETDYTYDYKWVSSVGELKEFLRQGNWAIRQAVILYPLCFMQQVNGGDEWLTLKFFKDHGWVDFESITFEHTIARGNEEFEKYLYRLIVADYEQCTTLNY